MDGDRQSQTPTNGPQTNPNPNDRLHNPPSLNEPSLLRRPTFNAPVIEGPAGTQDSQSSPATTELSGGFFRPEEPVALQSDNDPSYGEPTADRGEPKQPVSADETVSWTSSGDDLQGHAASWRIKMLGMTLVLAGLIYLLTRDLTNAVLIVVAGLVFGLLGSRKPHPLQYVLDNRGIAIGQKQYGYGEFRAFSVANGVAANGRQPHPTINLVPLRRFLPILSVHFDQLQMERIVNVLAVHLPMEAPRHDAIDKIVSRIKF